ncbi:Uncharacterised protein [Mycobacterium tuberculosis]|nr:Uncharacterised protein [Mycobacterium tuberculosis]
MTQHQPGFIEDDEARRAGQPFLDAAKHVGQDWNEIALAHVHQLLDLEGLEGAEHQPVLLRIEQLSHRTVDRVVMQRVLDLAHLHARDEVRQRSPARLSHQADLPRDGVAMIGRDRHALHRDERLDPFHRPGAIGVGR